MRYSTRLLFFVLLWTVATSSAAGNAVEYRGVVYVSLDELVEPDFLDGTAALTDSARVINVQAAGRRVRFAEGGDRVIRDAQAPVPLQSPVLVLDGEHYVPIEECASHFGYRFVATPGPALTFQGRRMSLDIEPLKPAHLLTKVHDLKPVHRVVVLTRALTARRHLHEEVTAEQLPAGTALLVRRDVKLNGTPHALVTRCDKSLDSFAVVAADLNAASRDGMLDRTHLGQVFQHLSDLASRSASIDHGPRSELGRTVAVTADLCWSLKPYERDFFRFLPRLAAKHGRASIALFMTGRWLAQHPEEMERLIELSREPGVDVTWALHSWSHPKERPFMNSFSPDELRADALLLEHDLLEWGIVPSIYYRFPGLVHDEERLRAILALDLVSVDCDSWVASMQRNRPPHHLAPGDGSILLIHGNGNEAVGISRLYQWMIDNPGWRFGRLNRFISPAGDSAG